jgi:hypothetical protein
VQAPSRMRCASSRRCAILSRGPLPGHQRTHRPRRREGGISRTQIAPACALAHLRGVQSHSMQLLATTRAGNHSRTRSPTPSAHRLRLVPDSLTYCRTSAACPYTHWSLLQGRRSTAVYFHRRCRRRCGLLRRRTLRAHRVSAIRALEADVQSMHRRSSTRKATCTTHFVRSCVHCGQYPLGACAGLPLQSRVFASAPRGEGEARPAQFRYKKRGGSLRDVRDNAVDPMTPKKLGPGDKKSI